MGKASPFLEGCAWGDGGGEQRGCHQRGFLRVKGSGPRGPPALVPLPSQKWEITKNLLWLLDSRDLQRDVGARRTPRTGDRAARSPQQV